MHRILIRHGLRRLPVNQKYQPHRKRRKRYEKPKPGHRLQMDVNFLERIPGTRKRLYQFTAIDDCTRIRVLKIFDVCNQRSVIQFLNEVRQRLPFRIHVVQTDNCSTATAYPTTSTCSTRNCVSGRTTTITIVRTGPEGQTPFERLMAKT